jgi:F-type H+-transporting ATPase subunit b
LIAQIINFAILLFLLKRYAYGPVIAMLRERRQNIEAGVKASDEAKKRLANAEESRKEILVKAEEEAHGVVAHAEKLAEEQAATILTAARAKSEQVIAMGSKKIEEERLKLEDDFQAEAQALIKKGLIATIGKMNPDERDEKLISEALRELKTIR